MDANFTFDAAAAAGGGGSGALHVSKIGAFTATGPIDFNGQVQALVRRYGKGDGMVRPPGKQVQMGR